VGSADEGRAFEECRGDDAESEVDDELFDGGQKQVRGARDAAANDNAVRMEGRNDVAKNFTEVLSERVKDGAGVRIGWDGSSDVSYFAIPASAGEVVGLDALGGDKVFHNPAVVGIIPDFATRRNAWARSHVLAVNGKGGSDAGAEGDTDGAAGSGDASTDHFAEDIGGCVIQEAEAIGSEAQALNESGAEVAVVEISELMFHQTDPGYGVEGAGNRERCADDVSFAGGGFEAETLDQISEAFEGGDIGEWRASVVDEFEIGEAAKAAADVAATNVVGQNKRRFRHGHGLIHALFAISRTEGLVASTFGKLAID